MTIELFARNLLVWWLHAAVLLTGGILGAQLVRWRHPHTRLRFLQALFVLVLVLPLVEPWHTPVEVSLAPQRLTPAPLVVAASASAAPEPERTLPWPEALLVIAGTGAALRLGYLAFGLLQLRRWRRQGEPLAVAGLVDAEVRVVDGLRGPASFGWSRPVILLPRTLTDAAVWAVALQHEHQHVIRRDWLESMLEQAAAALIWFQPAVWWLLERLQLAREQAVDAAVAGTGPERQHYLASLLVSAGMLDYPSLPVTHFVRRRHLVQRVALLTEERPMTLRHLTLAALSLSVATIGSIILLSGYVPLHAQPQPPAPPQPPSFLPSHRFTSLPSRVVLGGAPVEGVVTLELTVSPEGETVDARVLAGPDQLRKRALSEALRWNFSPEIAARRTLPMTMEFKQVSIRPDGAPPPPPPPPPPPVEQAEFLGVDYDGLTPEQQQRVLSLNTDFRTGQRFTQQRLDQLTAELKAIDPSLHLNWRTYTAATSATGFGLRLRISAGPATPQQLRVSGAVQTASLLHKVEAVYPPLALQARIQGTVRLNVTIGRDGSVERMEAVNGHPLLLTAAQEAVRQYRYKPTFLNGQPVQVVTTVDVDFRLGPI